MRSCLQSTLICSGQYIAFSVAGYAELAALSSTPLEPQNPPVLNSSNFVKINGVQL